MTPVDRTPAAELDVVIPAGTGASDGYSLSITPERAGWDHTSLHVLELAAGGTHTFSTGEDEWVVLPLSGGCTVSCRDHDGRDETFDLAGRRGVFTRVTDFAYVPRDAEATVTSREGGRFALCGARARRRLTARYGPAEGVPVELRGAGPASRQVNNFCRPDSFEADSMIAVEVLTPAGNWSSYPPHKHDEDRPGETRLEEVYYFEVVAQAGAPAGHDRGAVGYQRVYGSGPGREIDVCTEVHTGDAVLVPHGWHGPSMAAPGYDLYYLNVMAGPDPERAWQICDDPAHGWVRGTWDGQAIDPRLPLTSTDEKTSTQEGVR